MDQKERAVVADLCRRVVNHTFHERDVLGLLILLRQRAAAGAPIRELADFVAHRGKDRGLLKRVLDELKVFIGGTGVRMMTIAPVVSSTAFMSSINSTLSHYGLAPFDAPAANDVLAATMCLLQDVQLMTGGKVMGRLDLARTRHELHLWGLVQIGQGRLRPIEAGMSLIVVPNTYCSGPSQKDRPTPFDGVVEARCSRGALRLFIDGEAAG